jgi:hypothetical protein
MPGKVAQEKELSNGNMDFSVGIRNVSKGVGIFRKFPEIPDYGAVASDAELDWIGDLFHCNGLDVIILPEQ